MRRHLAVLAGQRAQRDVPVRIAEEPHVEHQIGIARQAGRETEAEHGDGEARREAAAKTFGDTGAQTGDRQFGGVDHQIGPALQGAEQFAFGADAIDSRTIQCQRMAPAGFGKAPDQHIIAAFQRDEPGIAARITQGSDALAQGGGIEGAGAAVDAECQRAAGGASDQRVEQR